MHISPGNRKLGLLPSLSLPPVITCNRAAGCTQGRECYAKRMEWYANRVTRTWRRNLLEWENNPREVESELTNYFAPLNRPRYFRWFIGGDFPDPKFFAMTVRVARSFPDVRFMVFTKRYDFIKGRIPKNYQIVISAWPGLSVPARLRRRFPVAWMRDPVAPDPRIPSNAIECPGGCDHCGMCWDLSSIGRDVVFDKH